MGRSKQRKTTREAAADARPQPALDRRFLDLTPEQVTDLLGRIDAVASPEDAAVVRGMAATVRCLDEEIKTKGTSIRRLRALAFGAVTETTRNLFPPEPGKPKTPREPKEPKPGHGPKGSTAYPTAERVKVPHGTLKTGDCCPECLKGRLYPKGQPAVMVRIVGLSPLAVKVIEREALRCNGCGESFTAAPPEGVGAQKYDETVPAMVALFRFGTGMPYARFARFQQNLGVPLPASTMNDLVMHSAELLEPALDELFRWAAQGELIHQDDTVMKLLDRPDLCKDGKKKGRKGVYTTGLISKLGRNRVALFITGMQHAGENLADLLKRRMADLPKPIQMCDAAAANTSKRVRLDTIVAHCLAHARRKFVEVVDRFPEECRHLLEVLKQVYQNDAATQDLPPPERLAYHQEHSGPLMRDLEIWLQGQIRDRLVGTQLRAGQGHRLHAQALAKVDAVPARTGRAARQQRDRTRAQTGHHASEKQPVLPDPGSARGWAIST